MCLSGAEPEPAVTVAFTEGPTVDREGNVYFTEITFSRIMKLGTDGTLTVFRENSNKANGLIVDAQGRLVICEGGDIKKGGRPRVTRIDLETGRFEVLAEQFEGAFFNQPNDLTMDSQTPPAKRVA